MQAMQPTRARCRPIKLVLVAVGLFCACASFPWVSVASQPVALPLALAVTRPTPTPPTPPAVEGTKAETPAVPPTELPHTPTAEEAEADARSAALLDDAISALNDGGEEENDDDDEAAPESTSDLDAATERDHASKGEENPTTAPPVAGHGEHSTHELDAVAVHDGLHLTTADNQQHPTPTPPSTPDRPTPPEAKAVTPITSSPATPASAASSPSVAPPLHAPDVIPSVSPVQLPRTASSSNMRTSARTLLRRLAAERVAKAQAAVRAALDRKRFAEVAAANEHAIDVDTQRAVLNAQQDLFAVDHSHDAELDDDKGRDKALLKYAMDQLTAASKQKGDEVARLLAALEQDHIESASHSGAPNYAAWVLAVIGVLCLCIAIPLIWICWLRTFLDTHTTSSLGGGGGGRVQYRNVNNSAAHPSRVEAYSAPYDSEAYYDDDDEELPVDSPSASNNRYGGRESIRFDDARSAKRSGSAASGGSSNPRRSPPSGHPRQAPSGSSSSGGAKGAKRKPGQSSATGGNGSSRSRADPLRSDLPAFADTPSDDDEPEIVARPSLPEGPRPRIEDLSSGEEDDFTAERKLLAGR